MCSKVKCRVCGKASWAGCGAHIESALAGVPKEERCRCRETAPASREGSDESSGLLGRLFRRGER